jgi:hypothetical protein
MRTHKRRQRARRLANKGTWFENHGGAVREPIIHLPGTSSKIVGRNFRVGNLRQNFLVTPYGFTANIQLQRVLSFQSCEVLTDLAIKVGWEYIFFRADRFYLGKWGKKNKRFQELWGSTAKYMEIWPPRKEKMMNENVRPLPGLWNRSLAKI